MCCPPTFRCLWSLPRSRKTRRMRWAPSAQPSSGSGCARTAPFQSPTLTASCTSFEAHLRGSRPTTGPGPTGLDLPGFLRLRAHASTRPLHANQRPPPLNEWDRLGWGLAYTGNDCVCVGARGCYGSFSVGLRCACVLPSSTGASCFLNRTDRGASSLSWHTDATPTSLSNGVFYLHRESVNGKIYRIYIIFMLCNPFHPFSSAGSVTVSVCSSLQVFLSVVFVKQFFKHYQNWDPSTVVPKQHISEPHTTTPPHTLTLRSMYWFLVSVACE